MNAAIARFFDDIDEKGDMLRGATPGGAPTLKEMALYRPHVSPGVDFLSVLSALKELRKQTRNRRAQKGDELLRALLLATASPSPTPSPTPSPSPGAVLKE